MSTETEIQTEVEALKARFSDTKQLYREVCALLFFRYDITPTANKLYQYVRRGSMSAPADALALFWSDLRSKARIEIDHPDLPQDVKEAAASAIAAVWRQASAAAREELRVLREESAREVDVAKAEVASAKQLHDAMLDNIELVRNQLNSATTASEALRTELEAERRAHAASAARIQELQRQIADLQAAQEAARTAFTSELEKAREAVTAAAERAAAAEKKALVDIDDERQAKRRVEQQLEQARAAATLMEAKARDQALTDAQEGGRLRAELEGQKTLNRTLADSTSELQAHVRSLQDELDEAKQDRVRYRAEAETAMAMVERLSPKSTAPARATKQRRAAD